MQLRIDPGFRALLPALPPKELSLLETLLRTDGCRDPLVVWPSAAHEAPTILDGHHRYEICTRLGIPFETVEVEKCPTRIAAILWMVTNQLARRNLTPSQKAAVSLELEKQLAAEAKKRMSEGGRHKGVSTLTPLELGKARDQAAALVGVSAGYIQEAKKIEHDAPEVLEQVKEGTLSIPTALKVAALPAEDRPAAIARLHQKEPEAEGGYIYHDGKLVAVQTNKEVDVWRHRSRQVIDAIEALATVDVSPEEYLRGFPPASADKIDAHLSAATRWLQHFVKCWEERT